MKFNIINIEFQTFHITLSVLHEIAPLKQKHLKENNASFITKDTWKAIMKRSQLTKVQLRSLQFVIHDEVLNFHGQILSFHELFHDKVKNQRKDINGLINGLLHLSNVKFSSHKYANDHCLWTLWTLIICCVSLFVYWFFPYSLQSSQVI